MAEEHSFCRTVITVEVLSEGPIPDDMDLRDVMQEATDGGFSADVMSWDTEFVDGPAMARLLKAQGSDPAFFALGDEEDEMWGRKEEDP